MSQNGGRLNEWPLSLVEGVEFRDEWKWGSKLTLRLNGKTISFSQVLPYPEGSRLLAHLAAATGPRR